jgi:hypothetical protein
MIVKKTKQLGNFKKGINLYVPTRRIVSAAPSGIPVASTASVNIAEVPYIYFSPFTKKLSGYEFQCNFNYNVVINSGLIYMNISENGNDYVLISPNTIFYKDGFIFYTVSNWKVVSFGDNEGSPEVFDISTNPSTDPTTIPTIGWSPAITITAAPEIGSDNPANAAEPDATAYVLIDGPFYNTPGNAGSGFVGGQSWRKMQPGVAVNGRASYSYGNEGVNWTGTQWQYTNTSTGVISSSLSDVAYPWLATAWTNGYSAAKVTSTYNKTTNYPAVP